MRTDQVTLQSGRRSQDQQLERTAEQAAQEASGVQKLTEV